MRELYVGVTTYNRWPLSLRTLESILAHTKTPFVMTVSDDNSTDATKAGLLRFAQDVANAHVKDESMNCLGAHVFTSRENLGVAKNKNIVINHAIMDEECKYVILLEDDCRVIRDGWEQVLIQTALESKQAHLCYMPKDIKGGTPFGNPMMCTGGQGTRIQWKAHLSGMCMFFTAKLLRAMGGFYEQFPGRYSYEHNDLSARAVAFQGIKPEFYPHPLDLEEGKYLECDDMCRLPMWNHDQARERIAKSKVNEQTYIRLMERNRAIAKEPGRGLNFVE